MGWALLLIIVAVILYCISIYNTLVKLKNQVDEGWSGIDVQLKRRHNLIPNLIATVKGYQQHESDTLEKITALRSQAQSANDMKTRSDLESALSANLGKLFVNIEAYPDLKANQNFLDLQQQLAEIEDQIQLARRYYNGATRDYNTKIESFPDVIIAKKFTFTARDFFEIDETAKEVPKVSF